MSNDLNAGYGNDWIRRMASVCEESSTIDSTLFSKYEVKRGLRDLNGQGVLTGLTEISEIRSYTVVDREMIPCEGKLYYQGIDIEEIVDGFLAEKRFGYEEVVYLLLFGRLLLLAAPVGALTPFGLFRFGRFRPLLDRFLTRSRQLLLAFLLLRKQDGFDFSDLVLLRQNLENHRKLEIVKHLHMIFGGLAVLCQDIGDIFGIPVEVLCDLMYPVFVFYRHWRSPP